MGRLRESEVCRGRRDKGHSSLPGALGDAEPLLQGTPGASPRAGPVEGCHVLTSPARPRLQAGRVRHVCSEPSTGLGTGSPHRQAKMISSDWRTQISSFLVKPGRAPGVCQHQGPPLSSRPGRLKREVTQRAECPPEGSHTRLCSRLWTLTPAFLPRGRGARQTRGWAGGVAPPGACASAVQTLGMSRGTQPGSSKSSVSLARLWARREVSLSPTHPSPSAFQLVFLLKLVPLLFATPCNWEKGARVSHELTHAAP